MNLLHSYGEDTLESWRRRGATTVQCWCLNTKCNNRYEIGIERAIEQWGEGTLLVMLARRMRCQNCHRAGCHVQVSSRLSNGKYVWD